MTASEWKRDYSSWPFFYYYVVTGMPLTSHGRDMLIYEAKGVIRRVAEERCDMFKNLIGIEFALVEEG